MDGKLDWGALCGVFEYKEITLAQVELVIASLEEIKNITDQLKAEASKKKV